jgi:hypothetical protein
MISIQRAMLKIYIHGGGCTASRESRINFENLCNVDKRNNLSWKKANLGQGNTLHNKLKENSRALFNEKTRNALNDLYKVHLDVFVKV